MKSMKKVFAALLVVVMILALSVTAFAQEVSTGSTTSDSATITVSNAAKGETYAVYKIFDATYNSNGSIAYMLAEGKTALGLPDNFRVDANGYVTITTTANELTKTEVEALAAYVEGDTAVVTTVSDGSELKFTGLDYGYYLVTTTQGDAVVSIDSTNPSATIVDKNTTTAVGGLKKTDDKEGNVSIGETVTYTVEFTTANYTTENKQIVSYTIEDTLPDFLDNVTVTKITIGGVEYTVDNAVPQFDNDGKITILWAQDGTSKYDNGAEIVITYTATVNEKAAIAGKGNTNSVSISYQDEDGTTTIDKTTATDTVYTYAIAIQKVNEKGETLTGAQFSIAGVAATGSDGVYTVTSTTAETPTTLDTDSNGVLVVKGLKSGEELTVTEVTAPDGYNKLTASVKVTPDVTSETTTEETTYFDDNGNIVATETETSVTTTADVAATVLVVVNQTGAELPSTGGIGTTIFTVVGIILMAGAAILLITKKRMNGSSEE